MPVYEVGKKVCEPSGDLVRFDITDSGAILLVQFRNPSSGEIRALKNGTAQFKYTVQDGVIYFLARFGAENWLEAPFHRDAAINATKLPIANESEGLSVHVMLVDAATGVLKVQRVIGLQAEFTRKLVDDILKQPIMTYSQYIASVNGAHMKYTIEQMVDMAKNEN